MKKGLLLLICIAGMAFVPACKKDKPKKAKIVKKKKTKNLKATKKLVRCNKCKVMHAPTKCSTKLVYCEKCNAMHEPGKCLKT